MLSISEPCYNNVVWTHACRQNPDPIPTICVLRVSAALEKNRKLQATLSRSGSPAFVSFAFTGAFGFLAGWNIIRADGLQAAQEIIMFGCDVFSLATLFVKSYRTKVWLFKAPRRAKGFLGVIPFAPLRLSGALRIVGGNFGLIAIWGLKFNKIVCNLMIINLGMGIIWGLVFR